MSNTIGNQIKQVLSTHCPSVEVEVLSHTDIPANLPEGHYLAIGANDPVEIDKIKSIMTMTTAECVGWFKDEDGDFMVYRVTV
jgi:TusA-related sulfurtransferase